MANTIFIGGKRLDDCDVETIVSFTSRPGVRRFDLGDRSDYLRNGYVLAAFADRDTATGTQLAQAFHECDRRGCSLQFNALRIGEALGWATDEGVVERGPDGWRLIHRERQYECIGPENRQRAIRVLNLPTAMEQRQADMLWVRELKRRERMRVKRVAKIKPTIAMHLRSIVSLRPRMIVEGMLVPLSFRPTDTIAAALNLILDAVDTLDERAANALERELFVLRLKLQKEDADAAPVFREMPPEDVAAFEGLVI